MALLDSVYKQRMVGALVLVALAVVFLPMLFSRQDEQHQLVVDVPAAPQVPAPTNEEVAEQHAPSMPVQPSIPVVESASAPVVAAKSSASGKPEVRQGLIDLNGLPISWSIQLASLVSQESAEALQKKLRTQDYNAYIRSADGRNRVFIGPLIERASADRLRDLLVLQHNLNGFVVRFQPERS